MQLQHNNLKEFDKRIGVESTKVKNLATSLEKVKKAIEQDKKAYTTEFKKGLDSYAENPHLTPQLQKIMTDSSAGLERLQTTYDSSTTHIQDVACNALGFLPKKFENHKKSLKLIEKVPESVQKLKDFEFDRIQYTRQALLHFLNA